MKHVLCVRKCAEPLVYYLIPSLTITSTLGNKYPHFTDVETCVFKEYHKFVQVS